MATFWLYKALVEAPLIAHRAANLDWYIYDSVPMGSVLPSLFLLMLTYSSLVHFLAGKWPYFLEFLYVKKGWNTSTGKERTASSYGDSLEKFLRLGKISLGKTIRPRELFEMGYREYESILYSGTAALAIVTAGFAYMDANHYSLVTEDYFEYSNYWSLEKHRVPYADVERVELECWIDTKGNPVVSYALRSGGTRWDILSRAKLRTNLRDYERVDKKLRAAGVVFGLTAGRRSGKLTYERRCFRELKKSFGPITYFRVKRLLHAPENFD